MQENILPVPEGLGKIGGGAWGKKGWFERDIQI